MQGAAMARVRAVLEALDGIALCLDARLRIVDMGRANWSAFWHANGGAGAAPDVLGRDITDYFSAGPVRTAFRVALWQVLTGERSRLRLPFRCDAPDRQRDMQLSVTRLGAGSLLYHSIPVATRPRRFVTGRVATDSGPVCAVCARAELDAAEAEMLAALDWPAPPEALPHAMIQTARDLCPRCHLTLVADAA